METTTRTHIVAGFAPVGGNEASERRAAPVCLLAPLEEAGYHSQPQDAAEET